VRTACSYCRKVIREDPGASLTDVSHGMCPECGAYFERLWAGMPLAEYLDLLPAPVVVVSEDRRIVAANARFAALVGRSPEELRGLLGGEALACAHSRLPEGCGNTVHCRECTIRRVVTRVARTSRAIGSVAAWLEGAGGRIELRISARQVDDFVEVTVAEAVPGAERLSRAGAARGT
jgi:PAS domain-containing protein